MKKILAVMLLSVLFVPVGVQAQEADMTTQLNSLKAELISLLMAQVELLMEQLEELKADQAALKASVNNDNDEEEQDFGAVEVEPLEFDVEIGDSYNEDGVGRVRADLTVSGNYDQVKISISNPQVLPQDPASAGKLSLTSPYNTGTQVFELGPAYPGVYSYTLTLKKNGVETIETGEFVVE